MEYYGTLDAGGLGSRRIDRLYLVEKFWGLYIAAEANSSWFFGGSCRQSLGCFFRRDVHFLRDSAYFQPHTKRGFAARLEGDLSRLVLFESQFPHLHFICASS